MKRVLSNFPGIMLVIVGIISIFAGRTFEGLVLMSLGNLTIMLEGGAKK